MGWSSRSQILHFPAVRGAERNGEVETREAALLEEDMLLRRLRRASGLAAARLGMDNWPTWGTFVLA